MNLGLQGNIFQGSDHDGGLSFSCKTHANSDSDWESAMEEVHSDNDEHIDEDDEDDDEDEDDEHAAEDSASDFEGDAIEGEVPPSNIRRRRRAVWKELEDTYFTER